VRADDVMVIAALTAPIRRRWQRSAPAT